MAFYDHSQDLPHHLHVGIEQQSPVAILNESLSTQQPLATTKVTNYTNRVKSVAKKLGGKKIDQIQSRASAGVQALENVRLRNDTKCAFSQACRIAVCTNHRILRKELITAKQWRHIAWGQTCSSQRAIRSPRLYAIAAPRLGADTHPKAGNSL